MFTVNLEKELIKQNKKVLLPQELLSIKEYERLGDDICESEILSRIGINKIVIEGKRSKENVERISKKLSSFDQTRVFHISQIESLCKKYHLRFLDTEYFKGSVDSMVASKISTFEIAHNITVGDYLHKCKIAAPAKSFALEPKPKDPLLFCSLGNGYWYLIHKWGNDLSIVRRLYRILSNAWLTYFTIVIPLIYVFANNIWQVPGTDKMDGNWKAVVSIICAIGYTIWSFVSAVEDEPLGFVKANEWNSTFL